MCGVDIENGFVEYALLMTFDVTVSISYKSIALSGVESQAPIEFQRRPVNAARRACYVHCARSDDTLFL